MANNQLKEELILNTQHFDKKIDDVIKQVNKLKAQGSKVGDGFNKSMGNLLGTVTKLGGALGLLTSGVQLADWFKNAVAEGTKLAKEGEGIRLAFERLNRGDLLDKLREETHGTVTDLELMKQAVKFNDFKLNLDEMGTLLAFAQQKAKDTGQSIDYMVDSIVTGLGRKSLPILDNLGLSAAEIKEKMKDGGDMTKAVAEIIKEKMNEAGDYIETTADRAKKKEVELQNELEKLGQTFTPLTEASSDFWHSLELGAIKATNKVGELLNVFTELGRVQNNYQNFGGSEKVSRMLKNLGNGKTQGQKNIYANQIKEFERHKKKYQDIIDKNPYNQAAKEQLAAVTKMQSEYERGAKYIFNSSTKSSGGNSVTSTKGGKKSSSNIYQKISFKSVEVDKNDTIRYPQEVSDNVRKALAQADDSFKDFSNETKNWTLDFNPYEEFVKNEKTFKKSFGKFEENASTIADSFFSFDNVVSDIESLSYALSEGANAWQIFMGVLQTGMGIIQAVGSVLETLTTLQEIFGATSTAVAAQSAAASATEAAAATTNTAAKSGEAIASATAEGAKMPFPLNIVAIAAGVAAVIAALGMITGAFANGGIVGGNSYGGDRLLARVNSGEAIINTNQQKHLFELLNNGTTDGNIGGNVHFVIRGKDLHGCLRNYNSKMDKVI